MENLGIDTKLIIAQLVNFIILFFVFKKFISNPFVKFINEERRKDEEKNKLLGDLNERAAALEAQKMNLRQEQKKEMEKVMTEIRTEATQLKEELVQKAHKEAEEIITKSKRQIEEERVELYKELKQKVVTVSTLMVEKGLQNFLNEQEQRNITQNILENLPNDIK
jgi:F-type H+-transporting ATPase subunit b